MARRQIIDLNKLAQNRCAEIDEMLSGIGGNLSSTLWTAAIRPALRGGKPCGQTLVKEPLSSDHQ
jgi:hypothetical protein